MGCVGTWFAVSWGMRIITLTGIVAMSIIRSSVGFAGPGDYRENRGLADVAKIELACPANTELVVRDAKGGPEEVCLDSRKRPHGYYLRWHKDNQSWSQLGLYENGTKVGRWYTLNPSGAVVRTHQYPAPRILAGLRHGRPRETEPRPEAIVFPAEVDLLTVE